MKITGDVFSVLEFEDSINFQAITNYDGLGELLLNEEETKYYGLPIKQLLNQAKQHQKEGDIVLVIWYNK